MSDPARLPAAAVPAESLVHAIDDLLVFVTARKDCPGIPRSEIDHFYELDRRVIELIRRLNWHGDLPARDDLDRHWHVPELPRPLPQYEGLTNLPGDWEDGSFMAYPEGRWTFLMRALRDRAEAAAAATRSLAPATPEDTAAASSPTVRLDAETPSSTTQNPAAGTDAAAPKVAQATTVPFDPDKILNRRLNQEAAAEEAERQHREARRPRQAVEIAWNDILSGMDGDVPLHAQTQPESAPEYKARLKSLVMKLGRALAADGHAPRLAEMLAELQSASDDGLEVLDALYGHAIIIAAVGDNERHVEKQIETMWKSESLTIGVHRYLRSTLYEWLLCHKVPLQLRRTAVDATPAPPGKGATDPKAELVAEGGSAELAASGQCQTANRLGFPVPACPGCGSPPAADDVDDECPRCGGYFFHCGIAVHHSLPQGPDAPQPSETRQQMAIPRWERLPPSQVRIRAPAEVPKLADAAEATSPQPAAQDLDGRQHALEFLKLLDRYLALRRGWDGMRLHLVANYTPTGGDAEGKESCQAAAAEARAILEGLETHGRPTARFVVQQGGDSATVLWWVKAQYARQLQPGPSDKGPLRRGMPDR